MTARNKNGSADDESAFLKITRRFALLQVKRETLLAGLAAFLISALAVQISMRQDDGREGRPEFEEGKVAERDFVAEYPANYVDYDATRRALEEAIRKLPAVFKFDGAVTERLKLKWNSFVDTCRLLFPSMKSIENENKNGPENAGQFRAAIERDFGGVFQSGTLESLYDDPERYVTLDELTAIFNEALALGIFKFDGASMNHYHPRQGELVHNIGQRMEREIVQFDRVLTLDRLDAYIRREAEASTNPTLARLAAPLLEPFLNEENVFFSTDDTELRLAQISADPVTHRIERGERVIRKGFLVTADDMEKLAAFSGGTGGGDALSVIGQMLAKILIAFFIVLWGGRRMAGRLLRSSEVYLLCGLSVLYFICVAAFRDFSLAREELFPVSIVFPTAICVMLPSFLIGHRVSLVMAVSLSAGAFVSGAIDANAFVFALASGVAASLVLHNAQKRMDIVKAGILIAAVQTVSIVAILLAGGAPLEAYPGNLFWSAFNGIASGMLVLGILPPLEIAMNAATSFRLIELSDVNAPMLKRLFTVAPGTYSHSMMVAHLAEAAAQEIGANALLARVGAYYHDIGKMEQPDYFVENQGGHNKHDDIAPRLSATILRSHVKIGVEKARILGLPGEVIDIIAEHHGNSLIRWFYDAAVKREGTVNQEDFCYPGNPPRTRESAVVMLADVTEAATRTLDKPSVSRLEKFIGELIESKIAGGQLSESDMTFRDLETVKKTFVRVLAGYYHSRIEYPKDPNLPAPAANGNTALSSAIVSAVYMGKRETKRET
jgi:putative nucleotidyltransferase with HDIG domain